MKISTETASRLRRAAEISTYALLVTLVIATIAGACGAIVWVSR